MAYHSQSKITKITPSKRHYISHLQRVPGFGPTSFVKFDAYLNAGMTSLAKRSSSFMMCACGMPGKNVRQIRCVMP